MRRHAKIRALSTRVPLRKAALTASAAARRPFPAWIDANEGAVAFPAVAVTPRVRDALVLRTVVRAKQPGARSSHDAHGAR